MDEPLISSLDEGVSLQRSFRPASPVEPPSSGFYDAPIDELLVSTVWKSDDPDSYSSARFEPDGTGVLILNETAFSVEWKITERGHIMLSMYDVTYTDGDTTHIYNSWMSTIHIATASDGLRLIIPTIGSDEDSILSSAQ